MKIQFKSLAVPMSALVLASVVSLHSAYAEDGTEVSAPEAGAVTEGVSQERQELKDVNQKIQQKNAEIRKERIEKKALKQERRKLRRQVRAHRHQEMKK